MLLLTSTQSHTQLHIKTHISTVYRRLMGTLEKVPINYRNKINADVDIEMISRFKETITITSLCMIMTLLNSAIYH
jgi:hypothetical protein